MLKNTMQKALNDQINMELYSAYLYFAMVAYFEDMNLGGFAAWLKAQTQEEMFHAMKIFNYVFERGGRVELAAIETPPKEWNSPLDAFRAAYDHECKVSDSINKLVDLARGESDHATDNFLQWFVAEQVEEEDNVDGVVQSLTLAKDAPNALLMLDRELGSRTFTAPAAGEEG